MVQSKPKIAWSKEADRKRRELVAAGAGPVFETLDRWLAGNAYLWARARVVGDPESEDPWEELVVEIAVDAEGEVASALWDGVADAIRVARSGLSDSLHTRLLDEFGVHLLWGAGIGAAIRRP